MTNVSIAQVPNHPQVVSSAVVTLTASLIRVAHRELPSLCRALNKVTEENRLITQPWRYEDGVLAITSHSHPNVIHYATPDGCDCETTRGVCWHRASALVLQTLAAAGVAPIAILPLCDESALDEADAWDPADAGDADEVAVWSDGQPGEPRYFTLGPAVVTHEGPIFA